MPNKYTSSTPTSMFPSHHPGVPAVVEAAFHLDGQQCDSASQLLQAAGVPVSLHPSALKGQLVIRREIQTKQQVLGQAASASDAASRSPDSKGASNDRGG